MSKLYEWTYELKNSKKKNKMKAIKNNFKTLI